MTDAEQLAKLLRERACQFSARLLPFAADKILRECMPVASASVPAVRQRLIEDAVRLVAEARG
jgi:hypothetical protein